MSQGGYCVASLNICQDILKSANLLHKWGLYDSQLHSTVVQCSRVCADGSSTELTEQFLLFLKGYDAPSSVNTTAEKNNIFMTQLMQILFEFAYTANHQDQVLTFLLFFVIIRDLLIYLKSWVLFVCLFQALDCSALINLLHTYYITLAMANLWQIRPTLGRQLSE